MDTTLPAEKTKDKVDAQQNVELDPVPEHSLLKVCMANIGLQTLNRDSSVRPPYIFEDREIVHYYLKKISSSSILYFLQEPIGAFCTFWLAESTFIDLKARLEKMTNFTVTLYEWQDQWDIGNEKYECHLLIPFCPFMS